MRKGNAPQVRSAGDTRCYAVDVAERRHQVRVLTSLGHSAADIARRLGVAQRTVVRIRAIQRVAA